ncbi:MAG: Uncharacterized protein XD64_1103 [Thermotoga sp. 47_83]|jgi:hypothetical protein|uniref:DUF4897 domain-containing protein n=1 Tax=Thermotoga TaxID=2335 RepID=UPI0002E8931A|nr:MULTISPECIES: DUF4897 domain-containing protein [Thermotoga]AIY87797.1 hypothetical protein CELL2_02315 [Thermotoga sp. Cell2]KHC90497.1 hypothetical protein Mc24_09054 [Thermotoga sp. Mc24]KUK33066.1 MAG: Uncharacterized protein XD64_1103 [Thermotoga sp. 47_83]MBZ4661492.1 hypothetical protein [Thermotoga sp.]
MRRVKRLSSRTIYILLIIMVVFMLVEFLFFFLGGRAPFEIVYYRSTMEYDYSGNATFTTSAKLYFKDEKKKEEYKINYASASKEELNKYFSQISKEVGREIVPLDYNVRVEDTGGMLEVTETTLLRGAAQVKGDVLDTSMGSLTMNVAGETEIVVKLPEDAAVISVTPTPSERENNTLIWRPDSSMVFPKVIFKRVNENEGIPGSSQ